MKHETTEQLQIYIGEKILDICFWKNEFLPSKGKLDKCDCIKIKNIKSKGNKIGKTLYKKGENNCE